jgi:serine/threonine-protein kinase
MSASNQSIGLRADSMPRLMQKIATEPHPSVRTLRPDLSPCVDFIINRALAKDAAAAAKRAANSAGVGGVTS